MLMAQKDSGEPAYGQSLGLTGWRTQLLHRPLLLMAGLPLLDGVFLAAVTSGRLDTAAAAASVGFSVFSGAGCLAAVANMDGNLGSRVRSVTCTYAAILAGAEATVALAGWLRSIFIPEFSAASAWILFSLACNLVGFDKVTGFLRSRIPRFAEALAAAGRPTTIVLVMAIVSLLWAAGHGVAFHPEPAGGSFLAGVAVATGFVESLLGATLGSALHSLCKPVWIRRGAGAAIATIGLRIIGVPLPSVLPLVVLAIALVGGIVAARVSGLTRITAARLVSRPAL